MQNLKVFKPQPLSLTELNTRKIKTPTSVQ